MQFKEQQPKTRVLDIVNGALSKKTVTEAKELTMQQQAILGKAIKSIEKKTSRNDHTGALQELADLVGAKQISAVMTHIAAIQKMLGYAPKDLQKFRDSYLEVLLKYVKEQYDEDAVKEVRGAF
ncbi:MAG: hypothetical protein BV459_00560 [Thermoplasmata archaeon M11B2D]|nr:MAG: hypothetical protein BV459_00560 [Thermoplasmata archaeon M11B2D]